MREDTTASNRPSKRIRLSPPQLTPGQKLRQEELKVELACSQELLRASWKRGPELEAAIKAAKREYEKHQATEKELFERNSQILAKLENIPNM